MDDQLFKIIMMLLIALVTLAQSIFIAFKVVAKRAAKKNEKHGNPNGVTGKHKMCFEHDKDIALNTNNIANLAVKIGENTEQNRIDHKVMFKKLDDLKG